MKSIAIFASGSGTNAQNIIEYFKDNTEIEISLVLSNRNDALVLERARQFGVPTFTFDRVTFYETHDVLAVLMRHNIDLIVLAGFLWLVPKYLTEKYHGRIINIHPALLPKYGGKGMYGMRVHESVIGSGDNESGITIHYVNEKYDDGAIIFQAKCNIETGDTAQSLAQKIHLLEYKHFPVVIENLLKSKITSEHHT
jgi:phosphoribosylglycinamide formyltransferase-1